MTDLQLAVLLRQYHMRLISLIEQVEGQLPETMMEVRENKLFPQFEALIRYPITDNLRDMADDINGSIVNLEKSVA